MLEQLAVAGEINGFLMELCTMNFQGILEGRLPVDVFNEFRRNSRPMLGRELAQEFQKEFPKVGSLGWLIIIHWARPAGSVRPKLPDDEFNSQIIDRLRAAGYM